MTLHAVSPIARPYLNQRRELPRDLEGPGVWNRPASVCVCVAGIVGVRGQLKPDEHAERSFIIQYLIWNVQNKKMTKETSQLVWWSFAWYFGIRELSRE